MRFFLSSMGKDLRRLLTDPVAIVIWIGIPVLLGGLMSLIASGNRGVPKARILLADLDDTFLSSFLGQGAGGGGMGDFLEIEKVELEEGRRRIDDGDGTALLILPKGFAEAVLEERPTRIELVTNPAQRILPRIVEQFLEVVVEASFYLQRLLGDQLREMAAGPGEGDFFPDARVAEFSMAINQRVRSVDKVLFPPILKVEEKLENPEADQPMSFALLFLPGILFMSLLFIAQGVSEDVWREKDQGTLRRIVATPPSIGPFLAGKVAAGALLIALVSTVGLAVAALIYTVDLALLPVTLAWCTFVGAALLVYFILVQTLASSQRGGNILSMVIVFPLMMIGGSFFPFEAMPEWMASIGSWTPNGVGVVRFKELLQGELALGSLGRGALAIGVPAVLAFGFTLRRLRGRFVSM